MFGSGEKTVAPTIDLPSLSFCLAVLKTRAGAACCCTCASASSTQHKVAQRTMMEMQYRVLIRLLLGRKHSASGLAENILLCAQEVSRLPTKSPVKCQKIWTTASGKPNLSGLVQIPYLEFNFRHRRDRDSWGRNENW